ncbi:MAG: hypothetical protein ACR2K5_04880 [Pseudolabrys sp.]
MCAALTLAALAGALLLLPAAALAQSITITAPAEHAGKAGDIAEPQDQSPDESIAAPPAEPARARCRLAAASQ